MIDWANKHPWLTFFLASSVIGGIVQVMKPNLVSSMIPGRASSSMAELRYADAFLGRRMPRVRR